MEKPLSPNKNLEEFADMSKLALDNNFDLKPEDIYKLAEKYKPAAEKKPINTAKELQMRDFGDYIYQFPEINNPEFAPELREAAAKRVALLMRLDYYMTRHENDTFKLQAEGGKLEHKLRDYQYQILENFYEFLFNKKRNGFIAIPTGTGKTAIFSEIAEALNLKTMIVAPTIPLVEQTTAKLQKFTPKLTTKKIYSVKEKEADIAEDMKPDEEEEEANITVITYASLKNKLAERSLDLNDIDLIIYDEAHHSLEPENFNAIKKIIETHPQTINLGLTASPKPEPNKDGHVGELFTEQISTMGVQEAIAKGYLSKFKNVKKSIALKESELTSPEVQKEIIAHYIKLREQIRKRKKDNNYEPKFIAYCQNVQHADDLAKRMDDEHGIKTDLVYYKLTRAQRDKIFDDLEKGTTIGLTNVNVLTEGFDEDSVEIILNISPTESTKKAEQRAGRGLRLETERTENINPEQEKIAHIVDYKYNGMKVKNQIFFDDIINRPDDAKVELPKKGWLNLNRITYIIDDIVNQKITSKDAIINLIKQYKLNEQDGDDILMDNLAKALVSIDISELAKLLVIKNPQKNRKNHLKEIIETLIQQDVNRHNEIRLCKEPIDNEETEAEDKNSLYISPELIKKFIDKLNNINLKGKFAPDDWQRVKDFPELILGISRQEFIVKVFGKGEIKKLRPSVFIESAENYVPPKIGKLLELVSTTLQKEIPEGYIEMEELFVEIKEFAPKLEQDSIFQRIFLTMIDQKESGNIAYVDSNKGKNKKVKIYLSPELYKEVYKFYEKYKTAA